MVLVTMEIVLYIFCGVVLFGLYLWIWWLWMRDSYHSIIFSQNQFLQFRRKIQRDDDNAFLNALDRG